MRRSPVPATPRKWRARSRRPWLLRPPVLRMGSRRRRSGALPRVRSLLSRNVIWRVSPPDSPAMNTFLLPPDPAAKATAEQVGGLFDAARAMDDQTFKARRAALPREWAQVVMPNILQRLADPASRDEQLAGVINRLLDYRRGEELVRAKQDALAER